MKIVLVYVKMTMAKTGMVDKDVSVMVDEMAIGVVETIAELNEMLETTLLALLLLTTLKTTTCSTVVVVPVPNPIRNKNAKQSLTHPIPLKILH